MKATELKWYTPEENTPEKSGNCLVLNEAGFVMTVHYSKIHNLFNAYDYEQRENAEECAFAIKYWAEFPKELKV